MTTFYGSPTVHTVTWHGRIPSENSGIFLRQPTWWCVGFFEPVANDDEAGCGAARSCSVGYSRARRCVIEPRFLNSTHNKDGFEMYDMRSRKSKVCVRLDSGAVKWFTVELFWVTHGKQKCSPQVVKLVSFLCSTILFIQCCPSFLTQS